MIAVIFQDGGIMTFATRLSRKKQIEEAQDVLEGANEGIKRGNPLARIVEVDVKITKELL